MLNVIGKPVKKEDLLGLFEAPEGEIHMIYGRIGGGKTYKATADALAYLKSGRVVYADWRIMYTGYDERESFFRAFFNIIFFRRRFYQFEHQNFHFYEKTDSWAKKRGYNTFVEWFATRTDCVIYCDEVHELMDSYETTRFSLEKRKSILRTRHVNRTLVLITQRPTALHVSARANVNRFFKCDRLLPFLTGLFKVRVFRCREYQDMVDESVDEGSKPVSTSLYWGSKHIFAAYNSKYLRGGIPVSQEVFVSAWDYSLFQRFVLLVRAVLPPWGGIKSPPDEGQNKQP